MDSFETTLGIQTYVGPSKRISCMPKVTDYLETYKDTHDFPRKIMSISPYSELIQKDFAYKLVQIFGDPMYKIETLSYIRAYI